MRTVRFLFGFAGRCSRGQFWKALGLAQNGVSRTEDAKASFQKSIEADPKDPGAHFQLGQVLEVLGDLPGARAEYERSIALNPTEPEVFGRLTQVCGRLGDAEGEARAHRHGAMDGVRAQAGQAPPRREPDARRCGRAHAPRRGCQ